CVLPSQPQPTPLPMPTAAPPPIAPLPTAAAGGAPTPPLPSAAPAGAPTNLAAPTTPPAAGADELSRIAAAAPLPRDQVALAEALKGIGRVSAVARTTPLDVKVGDVEKFWVANFVDHTNFQVDAKLRYAGPV